MSININDIVKIIGDDVIVFEIGSNIGVDTERFLHSFSNIKIYCFEPDPRCIKKFKKIINDSRVTLIESAVSDKGGLLDFYLSSGFRLKKKRHPEFEHISSSSIKKPTGHKKKYPWCKFKEIIKVQTVKLDTWCEDNLIDNIDFIWADVQGAEEELILGAKNILRKTRYFYTEYSDKELYKNQINKNTILKMLPWFEVEKDYGDNILLKNKEIAC